MDRSKERDRWRTAEWPCTPLYGWALFMRMRSSHSIMWLLFLFLVVSSAAILYTTAQNAYTVRGLASQALQSTAFALASSAENVLQGNGRSNTAEIREIFSDRIVAYALIARPDGAIFFHTNPALVGSRLSRDEVDRLLKAGVYTGRRITLKTGVPAFQFDYLLHGTHGAPELLRLVLHTSPADILISKADRVWWTVGAVLLLLWSTGIGLGRMFIRYLRLQAELEKERQMALVGRMTAVLAHEIRNALASIKGYTQLVDEKTPQEDERKPALDAVLTGTARIESTVNNLLLFSRNEKYDMKSVDVTEVLHEASLLPTPTWKGSVEFIREFPVYAIADREKLHRVVANGIRNALEAMGETGVLRLSAEYEEDWAVVRIEDTGTGLTAEAKHHLFVPFHTTKVDGTGLGLAYSEKVIKGMDGTINLSDRSEGRQGAVLTFRLPKDQRGTI